MLKMCVKLANTMSDTVICSGPLPAYRDDEIHSRLCHFNGCMSKWCPLNNIGFIAKLDEFWGRPGLLKRDGLTGKNTTIVIQQRHLVVSQGYYIPSFLSCQLIVFFFTWNCSLIFIDCYYSINHKTNTNETTEDIIPGRWGGIFRSQRRC